MNSGVHVDALVNLAIVLIVALFPLALYRRAYGCAAWASVCWR
jgi:hypothetical protein